MLDDGAKRERIQIFSDGTPNNTTVTLGGKPLPGVREVAIYLEANALGEVNLTLTPGEFDLVVDGDFKVNVEKEEDDRALTHSQITGDDI